MEQRLNNSTYKYKKQKTSTLTYTYRRKPFLRYENGNKKGNPIVDVNGWLLVKNMKTTRIIDDP